MTKLPLIQKNGYLFIKINNQLWLIDTGSPASFGNCKMLNLADKSFNIRSNYMSLSVDQLSKAIGIEFIGLLGADILNEFDYIFNLPNETLQILSFELNHDGLFQELESFMGVPIIKSQVSKCDYRFFFDTGAAISYFHAHSIHQFQKLDQFSDFYPGFGAFQTETYAVEFSINIAKYTLRCGTLPDLIAATLMLADAQGIIGNEILLDKSVGYFPRRNMLCL